MPIVQEVSWRNCQQEWITLSFQVLHFHSQIPLNFLTLRSWLLCCTFWFSHELLKGFTDTRRNYWQLNVLSVNGPILKRENPILGYLNDLVWKWKPAHCWKLKAEGSYQQDESSRMMLYGRKHRSFVPCFVHCSPEVGGK